MQYLVRIVQALLLLGLATAFYAQTDTGLADNGDYSRAMTRFVTGPVGFAQNWPDSVKEPDKFDQRFFRYWIPYWKLDSRGIDLSLPGTEQNSSAILLWLPGALLNQALYSPSVLYLPYLSLAPKLLLIGALWLIFLWLDHGEFAESGQARLFFSIALGVPFVLVVSATDYVAYFNTFYFETASFVFAILFLVSLVLLDSAAPKYSKWAIIICLVLLLLLASAKISTIYWPLIGIPFIFYLIKPSGGGFTAVSFTALALLLFLGAIWIAKSPEDGLKYNAVDRFYYGILTFSDDPTARLSELGIPESASCVNVYSQTPRGIRCVADYGDQASFQNMIAIVIKEPVIVLRMAVHSAESAQQVSVGWGKRAIDDPMRTVPNRLNLWGLIRSKLFPRGLALLAVLAVYAALFAYSIRSAGLGRGLSIVGLVSVIGSLVDMQAAIWGAGRGDLSRHLFLANALFDFATICAFNLMAIHAVNLARRKINFGSMKGYRWGGVDEG